MEKRPSRRKQPTPEESEKMIDELEDISGLGGVDNEAKDDELEYKEADAADVPPPDADIMIEEEEDDSASEEIVGVAADVPVQVVAVLGKKSVSMRDLAKMRLGSVVELNRPLNEVVDLVAGNRLIAKGELVDVDGKMGVRIIKMVK